MSEKLTYKELENRVRELEEVVFEYRQAEEMLRKKEVEFRLTVDELPVGVIVHDADTRILISNQEASNILGLTADQLSGKEVIDPAWMFVYEDLSPMKVEDYPVSRVISTKNPLTNYVLGIIRPDRANITWVNVNARPLFFADGKLEKVIVNCMDITEQKQTEEAIKKNESMHSKMVANTGDVIVIIDQDGINRYKSPNIEKLFGWKTKEVVGVSTWENVHPDDLESAQKFLENLMHEPNTVGTTECRYKCRDGSYRWIEFTGANLLHDPDINGILGNYHDITDRKHTEQSLRESEIRFKALHNASFGGIVIHDKGIILECNQGMSEMTGYSVTELIGMNGLLLIEEKSRDAVMNNIVSGHEKPYESIALRKDGTTFPLRIEARNVPYKGKIVRTVEFRDITENKRAEEEQEKLQSQLIHAQKMESVGRLAGGVAHDFNNMLSVILGFTELGMDKVDQSEPIHNNLQEIYKAAMRSAEITRQLLAFARQQTVSPKVFALNDTIESTLKMLRRLIGEDIDLAWLPGAKVSPVKMDPSQIDQILANLCVNARDAIADVGKITIETKNISFDGDYCANHAEFVPGDYVMLIVSDNGSGMTAEVLKNLFEPFFTTKGVNKGTGLGLATVYGIVKQNNGFIDVHSEPGKGSVFKIYFPQYVGPDKENRKNDLPIPDIRGSETILLVEDEPAILRMTRTMLEKLGYTVIVADTPGKAADLACEHAGEIHLLMTDVIMPDMNGRDLAENLLTLYSNLKCLFMSGYTSDVIAQHGVLDEGMQFIQKPFSKQDLAIAVRKAMGKY